MNSILHTQEIMKCLAIEKELIWKTLPDKYRIKMEYFISLTVSLMGGRKSFNSSADIATLCMLIWEEYILILELLRRALNTE